ncbi:MAG: hypothetical protein F4X82_01595 [Candidatus Spechtbacteria bacterium SB0662_bin_43]|uniref:Uncharacterized protein n=1 Tax=Candidatus Spechtbacteria bacterium SB0662_bin_43 TaxID=2604897 RepID=A0A845D9X2_9BACT|nr:hypothetical protein [Candidatus Spechtbacteria bacterium SB0662_bin_43]
MQDHDIISILQQARSIKPNKQWERAARDAMLVYTQDIPQPKHRFFGILTQWSKAPYAIMGCILVLAIAVGGMTLIQPENQITVQQEQQESRILTSSTPQPPTKNETTQDVLSALTATPIPTETIQQITEPEVQPSYSQEATRAFYEYLSSLDTLSEVDETNEQALHQAIHDTNTKAHIFISLLNIEGVQENEYFEYALRIAVLYRQQECTDQDTRQEITELVSQETIQSLIQANTLSLQCEKDTIPRAT